MNINFIFSIFAPKDKKFVPLFSDAAQTLLTASKHLQDLFGTTDDARRAEITALIKQQELKGDKTTSVLHKALYETFITPFDREDIDILTDKIDDCLDSVNKVALKVSLYKPRCNTDSAVAMVGIVQKAAQEVFDAMKEFSQMKRLNKSLRIHYKEIKKLEEAGDIVYEKAILRLFSEETDTVELIKQKEIITELEKTVNRFNQIGKTIKTILIKYA